jgi:Flp pilus assembly pilin Flp
MKVSKNRGQGLVEYCLIIALVAIIALAALRALGHGVSLTFNNAASALASSSNAAADPGNDGNGHANGHGKS